MTAPALAVAWLTPLTGIVVASALVPLLLALYFLKLRRRAASVPTTLLWKRSVEDMRANTPFQRLRPSLLLVLQLLLLGFVAFALMQPRMDLGLTGSGRTVILLDASASMGATDLAEGKTRLDVAKEQASERVEAIFAGGLFAAQPGETMVIAFSDSARIVQPFTRSKGDLLRAIGRVAQTDGASRIGDALALARAFSTVTNPEQRGMQPEEAVTLEVWSDGRIGDLADQAVRPGESVVYRVTGRADAANLGIEGVAAERSATDPGLIQVFASVRNDGREPVETDVELLLDGERRSVTPKPVRVPGATGPEPSAGGVPSPDGVVYKPGYERVTFPPVIQPRAGVMEVRLVRRDQLKADDSSGVAVAAPRRLRMAIVGPVDEFTRTTASLMPAERIETLAAADFAKLGAKAGDFDVVIAAASALPKELPPGRYLVLGAPAGIDGLNPYGTKDGLSVRSQKSAHPLLRAVNLDDLVVRSATAMAPASDVESIVDGPDVPLVLVARRGPVTAVITAFDPLQSNWPYQRGFVTFVANAVEWLGAVDQAAVQEEHHPGETLSVRVASGVREVELALPDGTREQVPVRDGSATWGPVARAGTYAFRWTEERGEQRRQFAVNPALGEGLLAAAGEISIGTQKVTGTAGGGVALSELWPYALAAALVILTLEWWVYHRRHWIRRDAAAQRVRPLGAGPGGDGAPIIRA